MVENQCSINHYYQPVSSTIIFKHHYQQFSLNHHHNSMSIENIINHCLLHCSTPSMTRGLLPIQALARAASADDPSQQLRKDLGFGGLLLICRVKLTTVSWLWVGLREQRNTNYGYEMLWVPSPSLWMALHICQISALSVIALLRADNAKMLMCRQPRTWVVHHFWKKTSVVQVH